MTEPLSLTATQYDEPSKVFVILDRSEISPRATTRSQTDWKSSVFALRIEKITVRVYDWESLLSVGTRTDLVHVLEVRARAPFL
jgi:hypothetical protein